MGDLEGRRRFFFFFFLRGTGTKVPSGDAAVNKEAARSSAVSSKMLNTSGVKDKNSPDRTTVYSAQIDCTCLVERLALLPMNAHTVRAPVNTSLNWNLVNRILSQGGRSFMASWFAHVFRALLKAEAKWKQSKMR